MERIKTKAQGVVGRLRDPLCGVNLSRAITSSDSRVAALAVLSRLQLPDQSFQANAPPLELRDLPGIEGKITGESKCSPVGFPGTGYSRLRNIFFVQSGGLAAGDGQIHEIEQKSYFERISGTVAAYFGSHQTLKGLGLL
jgi:hypothetical protein